MMKVSKGAERGRFGHYIEGVGSGKLAMGAGNAGPITVAFLVWASVPGVMALGLSDGPGNHSIVQDVTITAGGTWEYKTMTFLGDVAVPTWDIGSGIGLSVYFLFGSGANFRTSTPGVWLAGNKRATSRYREFLSSQQQPSRNHWHCRVVGQRSATA